MTAKEYLQQIRINDRRCRRLINEIRELKRNINFVSGIDYSKDRIQTTATSTTKQTAYIEKWVDLENTLTKQIDDYIDLKQRIVNQINSLAKPIYRDILYMRYVEYKRLEEIACNLSYSYDRVKHLHGLALQAFNNQFLKVSTK